jgi:methyltransferase (TIGR00027 family)
LRDDRASSTAVLVALATALLHHDRRGRGLIDPWCGDAAELSLHVAIPRLRPILRALRLAWLRRCAWRLEGLLVPGIIEHFAARKAFIREAVREQLRSPPAETPGVVIIGAGLDTLGPWLASQSNPPLVLEIDHAGTQHRKRRAVDAVQPPMRNLSFIDADLSRRSIDEVLARAGWPSLLPPRVVVAEGLTMYLTAAQVQGLFLGLARACRAHCALVFSFMEPDPHGRTRFTPQSRAIDWWLRWRGEPLRWGIRRSELAEFLMPLGWSLHAVAGPDEMRRALVSPGDLDRSPPPRSECVAVAFRGVTRAGVEAPRVPGEPALAAKAERPGGGECISAANRT